MVVFSLVLQRRMQVLHYSHACLSLLLSMHMIPLALQGSGLGNWFTPPGRYIELEVGVWLRFIFWRLGHAFEGNQRHIHNGAS